jgi:hypothetical protein
MRALLKAAQSSLQDVSQKNNAFNSITNERAEAFSKITPLAGQIIRTIQALQAPKETLADARYYSRLIAGRLAQTRLPVPSEDNEEEKVKTRPATQQSYVARAYHFHQLVLMVKAFPFYVIHETHLQVPALMETAARLNGLNSAWSKAKVALDNARMTRNRILYKGIDAVTQNAFAVKSYVKVVFGPRSGEAVQLATVSFTKPKKL